MRSAKDELSEKLDNLFQQQVFIIVQSLTLMKVPTFTFTAMVSCRSWSAWSDVQGLSKGSFQVPSKTSHRKLGKVFIVFRFVERPLFVSEVGMSRHSDVFCMLQNLHLFVAGEDFVVPE